MMIRAPLIGAGTAALLAALSPGIGLAEPDSNASSSPSPEPGVWQAHQVELAYLGFTSHYSCDGLESTLRLLLRQLGAREDAKVYTYGCDRGFTTPVRFPRAVLKFSTLQPAGTSAPTAWDSDSPAPAPAAPTPVAAPGAGAPAPANGVWRTVEIEPNRPFPLEDGDCELIEQFRDKVLPLFSTRDQDIKLNCIPYQDIGPFSVHLQVFAPPPAAKSR